MVIVLMAPALCVSDDVFMTCAKRRLPPKTRVNAFANSSQCVLMIYVFVNEIQTFQFVLILAKTCL